MSIMLYINIYYMRYVVTGVTITSVLPQLMFNGCTSRCSLRLCICRLIKDWQRKYYLNNLNYYSLKIIKLVRLTNLKVNLAAPKQFK